MHCFEENCANENCSFRRIAAQDSKKDSLACPFHMSVYEWLNSLSLEQLAVFLAEKFPYYESAPWEIWANEDFCSKCETIEAIDKYGKTFQIAPCETGECPYDMSIHLTEKDLIMRWLSHPMCGE